MVVEMLVVPFTDYRPVPGFPSWLQAPYSEHGPSWLLVSGLDPAVYAYQVVDLGNPGTIVHWFTYPEAADRFVRSFFAQFDPDCTWTPLVVEVLSFCPQDRNQAERWGDRVRGFLSQIKFFETTANQWEFEQSSSGTGAHVRESRPSLKHYHHEERPRSKWSGVPVEEDSERAVWSDVGSRD